MYLAIMVFCTLISMVLFVFVEMPWLNFEKFVVGWITRPKPKEA